jgi:prepilin-type N-terminal cleavage/methylation domain-containing protein
MENKFKQSKRRTKGFSLVEVIIATSVLAIGVLGSLAMIMIGIGRNSGNRMDTTATNVAQTVMEDIASVPASAAQQMIITDCQGNNLQITTAVGGSIDFSQPPAPPYQANYVMCGPNQLQVTYDVRWRIDTVSQGGTCQPLQACWAKMVTVSVQQPMNNTQSPMLFIPPVTLSTVVTQ